MAKFQKPPAANQAPPPHKGGKPPVKSAPPAKGGKNFEEMPEHSRKQMSEDTEREMTGRRQKYNMAAPEDDGDPGDEAAPDQGDAGLAPGGEAAAPPPTPGEEAAGEEMGPADPREAPSEEEAEQAAAAGPNTPEAHHAMLAKHHGVQHDLHSRLSKLEQHLGLGGGGGEQPAEGAGAPGPEYDDNGRG